MRLRRLNVWGLMWDWRDCLSVSVFGILQCDGLGKRKGKGAVDVVKEKRGGTYRWDHCDGDVYQRHQNDDASDSDGSYGGPEVEVFWPQG